MRSQHFSVAGKPMKVLLTGGTSLLGGAVATLLMARGDQVTCFQRKPSQLDCAEILGDLRDREAVFRAAQGHEAIVHLGALVAPRPSWSDAYGVNVTGTEHVIEAAKSAGRLVHVSTPSVAFENLPTAGAGTEAPRYEGGDAYARSKAIAERLVLSTPAVPTIVIRPHLVWGPGDTQLVGRIVDRARQGRLVLPDHGRALLDTTYIDDAAAALVAALDRTGDSTEALGRAWVVTGNDPRPLAELVAGILEAAGLSASERSLPAPLVGFIGRVVGRLWPTSEPPLTYFAARQLSVAHWFDQRETQRVLRWSPRVSVEEGMKRLAASFDG